MNWDKITLILLIRGVKFRLKFSVAESRYESVIFGKNYNLKL